MSSEELIGIPEPTLRRLPLYLHYLRELQADGRPVVSASRIGRDLRFDNTQVRKDLAATGVVGKPKIGFEVDALIQQIGDLLGFNNVKDAFLVGVGGLGGALLGYQRFNRYGLNIVAAFDNDPEKVGADRFEKPVYGLEKLVDLARRLKIRLGIITVPAEVAQECADLLVAGGVTAIWNFAPATLSVPECVVVQNEDLFASLAVLSKKAAASLGDAVGDEEERS